MRGAGWSLKYGCCELARGRKGTTYHRELEPAQGALGEGSAPKRRAARGTLRRWPRILRRTQNLDLLPPLNRTPRKENKGPVRCLGRWWRGCLRGLDTSGVSSWKGQQSSRRRAQSQTPCPARGWAARGRSARSAWHVPVSHPEASRAGWKRLQSCDVRAPVDDSEDSWQHFRNVY